MSLGLSLLFPLGSIPAVITGHIARHRISTLRQRGSGLALAGLILGWIGTAIIVLSFFVVFFTGAIVEDDGGTGTSLDACAREQRTLELASQAFRAETGYFPKTEEELVYAKYIERVSTDWDFEPGGPGGAPKVVPSPNGDC